MISNTFSARNSTSDIVVRMEKRGGAGQASGGAGGGADGRAGGGAGGGAGGE